MPPAEGTSRFRTRLPHLLSLWAVAAVAEAVLSYLALSQPYFRALFAPLVVAVLVAAGVGTWRLMRARTHADRRAGDRRVEERRAGE
jgi:hypothetical protein